MKKYLLIILVSCISLQGMSQTKEKQGQYGFSINSAMNGEVYPIRIIPSFTYSRGLSQVEVGVGFHPLFQTSQQLLSGDLNYKFFPNSRNNTFNLYLLGNFSFLNNKRKTYYPTVYNYLFLNAGYGFDISIKKGAYMGTNMSIGTFTYSKQSEVPYESFKSEKMFESFGFNLAFQFNLGYRF